MLTPAHAALPGGRLGDWHNPAGARQRLDAHFIRRQGRHGRCATPSCAPIHQLGQRGRLAVLLHLHGPIHARRTHHHCSGLCRRLAHPSLCSGGERPSLGV